MSAPKASSSGYRFLLQFESCGGARKTNLINCFNCRSDELSKGDSHVRLLRKRSEISELRREIMCVLSAKKVVLLWEEKLRKCLSP